MIGVESNNSTPIFYIIYPERSDGNLDQSDPNYPDSNPGTPDRYKICKDLIDIQMIILEVEENPRRHLLITFRADVDQIPSISPSD